MLLISTAVFPLADAMNINTTSKKENINGRNDVNATNLTLTITSGIGVVVHIKNVGKFFATNVIINVTITGGYLDLMKRSDGLITATLAPNDVLTFRLLQPGLGPITISATARADNAAPVTKTAKGFILLFYVIIK